VLATKLIHLERHAFDISTVRAATVLTSDSNTARDSVATSAGILESCKDETETPSREDMLNSESFRVSESDESKAFNLASLLSSRGKVVHMAWIVLTSKRCTMTLTSVDPVLVSIVTRWKSSGKYS
jgi:hypothetical protein